MLRWRLLLGVGFIAALFALMAADHRSTTPGSWLLLLALALGLAGAQEVVSLLVAGGNDPRASVIYGGTLLVIASNAVPLFWLPSDEPLARLVWPLLAFAASVLAAFVGEMLRYKRPGGVMVNVALAIFGVAYIGLTLSFACQLRILGGATSGLIGLTALVIVVKLGDIGAYTVGRLVGRRKMAPVLSPGKTWEGAAGGIVFACLGAWLAMEWLPRAFDEPLAQHAWSWLLFGPVVGVTGIVGDLAESLFKRDVGRKDSSTWMPGFGGVLDILDSILFAAPVAYFCWWLVTV
ncbi:MAG: phosphatidate cytidylyltransferase [Planctomycetota bacterium]|nr:MAG: phosphatidate cytidylyltransferase [Planctomycetota bacterium]